MRNKIGRRLTGANAIILVIALLIFCILSVMIFNGYLRKNIKEQLVKENNVAFRLAQLSIVERIVENNQVANGENSGGNRDFTPLKERISEFRQPAIYNTLIESITVLLIRNNANDTYEIIYSSVDNYDTELDLDSIEQRISLTDDNIIKVNINNTDFFLTMEQSAPRANKQSIVAMSLIPLRSVSQINRQYILLFLFTTAILLLISVGIMSIISNRITKPIVKLTDLTKQYAKRDFKNKYIANTDDEIEDLSKSVSEMAYSLESHNKQRDKMFRNISHELKTPLTAIYGYAEGIKNGVFKTSDEPLDIIMSESLRIKKLTEDIIYLSKLESQIEVFNFEKCDISDIMVLAIQSIESIAIMKDIDIKYDPKKADMVNVDKDKIHRALINILSNSVKYTKDTIDIDIADKRDSIEIKVSDNGSGFKQEDIDNLLSGMTKEKSNGSGIGLSIVNEIVKAHKGRFYIGNLKTGGAVLTIVLNK